MKRFDSDWSEEFGLAERTSPHLILGIEGLEAAARPVPQAHVIRRAFHELDLSAVLCQDGAPLIYFRHQDEYRSEAFEEVYNTFWSQGVAPILVLILPNEVHIYSSLSKREAYASGGIKSLVQSIERDDARLRAFTVAVQSGEYFREHRRWFDPKNRVDRSLLKDLEAARLLLGQITTDGRVDPVTIDSLICRLIFTCYLFDRGVIDAEYLAAAGVENAEHLRDILGLREAEQAKASLSRLFHVLARDFNGDLFAPSADADLARISGKHLQILNAFFRGTDPNSGQQRFWPYDFGVIPIETISSIYEYFLKAAGRKAKKSSGAYYTPRFLCEIVLDHAVAGESCLLGKKFLDPACGSGIFLVALFNRIAEEWTRRHPAADYNERLVAFTSIMRCDLFGVDSNRSACLIAVFSLYLALLDQMSPPRH